MDFHALPTSQPLTWPHLQQLGLSTSDVHRLVRAGDLIRLVRGAYQVPEREWSPTGGGTRFDDALLLHRRRAQALLSQFDGRAAASHTTAAVLHGLPLWKSSLERVHLTRVHDTHSRHRTGAVLHQRIVGRPLAVLEGHLTVTVADAIVGLGLLDPSPLGTDMLIAADHALRTGLVTRVELDEALARHRGFRGMSRVHQLGHADPRHESPAETRLGVAARALGWRSTPQVEHTVEGVTYRVDRQLDDWPVVLEVDGLTKYGEDALQQRRALALEKRREDALRSIGLVVVRIQWSELGDLELLVRRVRQAIARCEPIARHA